MTWEMATNPNSKVMDTIVGTNKAYQEQATDKRASLRPGEHLPTCPTRRSRAVVLAPHSTSLWYKEIQSQSHWTKWVQETWQSVTAPPVGSAVAWYQYRKSSTGMILCCRFDIFINRWNKHLNPKNETPTYQ